MSCEHGPAMANWHAIQHPDRITTPSWNERPALTGLRRLESDTVGKCRALLQQRMAFSMRTGHTYFANRCRPTPFRVTEVHQYRTLNPTEYSCLDRQSAPCVTSSLTQHARSTSAAPLSHGSECCRPFRYKSLVTSEASSL